MSEPIINESFYHAFIDAYMKKYPELTREEAIQAINEGKV